MPSFGTGASITVMGRIVVLIVVLGVLRLGFGIVERLWPSVRGQRRLRKGVFYHRWHHSAEREAINKNFSGLFPFVDGLFGTLYFPKGRQPTTFGVADQPVPAGFLPQLVYPFRSPLPRVATSETA
ncbi:MAG TPA: hypothetical protein VFY10_06750 [Dehalococcoidia bacterium]|nr:hypothetical protein [Dehalococcoidia bacterium]